MNNKLRKEKFLRITTALIISVLILCTMFLSNSLLVKAADTVEFNKNDFTAVELTDIGNTGFDSTSGDMPYTPSSWTETTGGGLSKGNSKMGVIDLAQYNSSADTVKNVGLEDYPEYADEAPAYPAGITDQGNKKFLMVNTTKKTETIVGYKSSDFNLAANKYYVISVWVKTGNFKDNTGASIRLNGLDGNFAFNNINTVKGIAKISGIPDLTEDNYYGWQSYSFYVTTGSLKSYSASLTLGVGDYYNPTDEDDTDYVNSVAKGYAFFDEVSVHEISATRYNASLKSASPAKKNIDLSLKTAFTGSEEIEFSFQDPANWAFKGQPSNRLIKAGNSMTEKNQYGLDSNPKSSTGLMDEDINSTATHRLDNVLLLTSYDKTDDDGEKLFNNIYTGITSKSLKIERYKFYRLSVWAYTENIGGAGASITVHTDKLKSTLVDNDNIDPFLNPENYESYTINNVTGDSSNGSRFGWQEYAFYIQGSPMYEYNIYLSLELGKSFSETGSGNALFHNIRFDAITNTEFSEHSANGTMVAFDSSFPANDNIGVANGLFMTIADYNKNKFPLVPASWTFIDAETAGSANQSNSTDFVDNDAVIKGVIATDIPHFNSKLSTDYKGYPLINPTYLPGHILLIGSKNQTAIGYRSESISVASGTTQNIAVSLRVDKIAGYGASIVLKNGSNIIASIENITDTKIGNAYGFNTFNFYVEGGAGESSVTVEIWLGLTDRINNSSKLSSGYIYVESVSSAAATDSYATYRAQYDSARKTGSKLNFAAYSFAGDDFGAYDYYDNSYVKFAYDWSIVSVVGTDTENVKYGIFNSKNFVPNNGLVPSSFRNSEDAANDGVFMMRVSDAAATVRLNRQTTLTASHYKITVKMRAEISRSTDKSVGAGIQLTGTDFKFENISTTVTEGAFDDPFTTYTFLVATGSTETTVGFNFSIGGSDYTSQYCSGAIYVNDITISDISANDYETAIEDMTTKELLAENIVKVNLGVAATDEGITDDHDDHDHDDDETNWWLFPSILASSAMLLALLGVVARKVSEKIARRRTVKYDNSGAYDRNSASTATTGKTRVSSDLNKAYEEFDDALPPAPSAVKKAEPRAEERVEPVVIQPEDVSEIEPDSQPETPAPFVDEFDD